MLNKRKRFNFAPIALILVTSIPIVLAVYFYDHKTDLHIQTKSYGRLITPVTYANPNALTDSHQQPLTMQELQSKWWLGVVSDKNTCTENCEKNLVKLETVRLALGKDFYGVDKMIMTTPNPQLKLNPGDMFIADNQHQIVLTYPADAQGNGILRDMRQLLKIGH